MDRSGLASWSNYVGSTRSREVPRRDPIFLLREPLSRAEAFFMMLLGSVKKKGEMASHILGGDVVRTVDCSS